MLNRQPNNKNYGAPHESYQRVDDMFKPSFQLEQGQDGMFFKNALRIIGGQYREFKKIAVAFEKATSDCSQEASHRK